MKDYIFILGRDPELSILELSTYLNSRKIAYKLNRQKGAVALISMEPQDFKSMIYRLGGTSKISEIIEDLDRIDLYRGKSLKIKYGISRYDETDITNLKEYLKQRFKEEKLKATLKKSKHKDDYLSPTEVIKQNLLTEGIEFIVFDGMIAKTIAVSNILQYIERDKPSLRSISIRLAKILINLAGLPKGTIIDPAKVTIAREAKSLGYRTSGNPDAIISAPWLSDKNYEELFTQSAKTVVVAVPKIRTQAGINLQPMANRHQYTLHQEVKSIKLPLAYKAKNSRIEREIWVFKRR